MGTYKDLKKIEVGVLCASCDTHGVGKKLNLYILRPLICREYPNFTGESLSSLFVHNQIKAFIGEIGVHS